MIVIHFLEDEEENQILHGLQSISQHVAEHLTTIQMSFRVWDPVVCLTNTTQCTSVILVQCQCLSEVVNSKHTVFAAGGGQLLIGSPVHDESVGDDHLLQVVLVVSGDTEKVQFMALLIIRNLKENKPFLQLWFAATDAFNHSAAILAYRPWQHRASQPPVYPTTHVTDV